MNIKEIDWSPITDWFGYQSDFHDAEVVSLQLQREPLPTILKLYAFRMTSDVDDKGYFILDRKALVTFTLMDVMDSELDGWNHQNALMQLTISPQDEGYKLELEAAWGADGYLVAKHITIAVEPWVEP